MRLRNLFLFVLLICVIFISGLIFSHMVKRGQASVLTGNKTTATHSEKKPTQTNANFIQKLFAKAQVFNPMAIVTMRKKKYPGSEITYEQNLPSGTNYNSYLVSYKSDNLKIYGLLTIPYGIKPKNGWPAILFNHGFVQPEKYTSTGYYQKEIDYFARNGYVVFMPDFRGNGKSEGKPKQTYISSDYVVDDLNALASVKKLEAPYNQIETKDAPIVNSKKVGIAGHSMGGNITLQDLVISKDIQAAVIWSGVIGSYKELHKWWDTRQNSGGLTADEKKTSVIIQEIFAVVGTPESNPDFWQAVDPTNFVKDINAPVQLHAGLKDEIVPWYFSESMKNRLKKARKSVEFYAYPEQGHVISGESFEQEMKRSLTFFDHYLK